MAQEIKITQTSNADMNIGIPKNLTAVEWLLSELQIRLLKIKSEPNGIVRETMINNFLIDTEQAKQMEEDKSNADYQQGYEEGYNDGRK